AWTDGRPYLAAVAAPGSPSAWRTLRCQMGPTRHLHRPIFWPSARGGAPRGRCLRNAILALPNRQFRFRLRLGGDIAHAWGCRGKGFENNMAMNLRRPYPFLLAGRAGLPFRRPRIVMAPIGSRSRSRVGSIAVLAISAPSIPMNERCLMAKGSQKLLC